MAVGEGGDFNSMHGLPTISCDELNKLCFWSDARGVGTHSGNCYKCVARDASILHGESQKSTHHRCNI